MFDDKSDASATDEEFSLAANVHCRGDPYPSPAMPCHAMPCHLSSFITLASVARLHDFVKGGTSVMYE
jgi:hypothetical protein